MKVITEVGVSNNIPTLLFYNDGAVNLPLILVVHGFNNDKYEGTKLALQLTEVGFAVLCFDIDRNGARYDGFMESIDSDVAFGTELFKVIENTDLDFEPLLDFYADDPRIDTINLGIVGFSIGANIANYELGRLKNLNACVSLLGSPKFVDLLVYSMEKELVGDFKTDDELKLLRYVESLDPREAILKAESPCP